MTNRLFVSAEKDPDRLGNLTGLQSRMLSHAMRAFTRAKKIVYSTCSIHPEENEKVVQECLEMCPDWKLIKPLEFAERWKHFGSPKFKHIGKKCVYAKSDIDLTDGFFVAIFEREIDPSVPIQPYNRDTAFLERISYNLKRKYPTETTTDLENTKTTGQETVDLTVDESANGTVTDNGNKKKKKKRKDATIDAVAEELTEIKQEQTDLEVDPTTNLKTENTNGTNVEDTMVTIKTEAEEEYAGKRKKKKRKTAEEVASPTPIVIDESINIEEKVKSKKKKRKRDQSPAETDVNVKLEEAADVVSDVTGTFAPDSDSIKTKKKKSKSK